VGIGEQGLRILGSKEEKIRETRRKQQKWNNKLYSSCNIIRVKKYGTMRYRAASKPDDKLPHEGSMKR
jgi:hypothetical protein